MHGSLVLLGKPSIRQTTDPGKRCGDTTAATALSASIAEDGSPPAQRVLLAEPLSMTTVTPEPEEQAAAEAGAAPPIETAPIRAVASATRRSSPFKGISGADGGPGDPPALACHPGGAVVLR